MSDLVAINYWTNRVIVVIIINWDGNEITE